MSYIERDALLKYRHGCDRQCKDCDFAIDDDSWCMGKLFAVDVLRLPAADVRAVAHGHWVTVEEANATGDYAAAYTCSVCGHCDWDCTESESFNYCPNCGAQMREVTASE